MSATDIHRQKVQLLIASIKAWSGFVGDVARVEVVEDGAVWRIALTPKTDRACALEMVLDGDASRCDVRLADQTYEDWELPSLDVVLPILEAVADGRVITRRGVSRATGQTAWTSTLIRLADGRTVEPPGAGRSVVEEDGTEAETVVFRDTHFLPYHTALR